MPEIPKCGTCQACCKSLGIREIQKPVGQHCKHQCVTGCAIYSAKPKSCQDYTCFYLQGYEGLDRPDKAGIIVDFVDTGIPGMDRVCVREVVPGAWRRPRNMAFIERIATCDVVMIMRGDGSIGTILGPPHLVKPIIQENERRGKSKHMHVSEFRAGR